MDSSPTIFDASKMCFVKTITLSVDIECTTMYKVIGKQGSAFKAITYESGCNYIWWDASRHIIEIYGDDEYNIEVAYARLIIRLDYIHNQCAKPLITPPQVNQDAIKPIVA